MLWYATRAFHLVWYCKRYTVKLQVVWPRERDGSCSTRSVPVYISVSTALVGVVKYSSRRRCYRAVVWSVRNNVGCARVVLLCLQKCVGLLR